jgi:hypothetical protein
MYILVHDTDFMGTLILLCYKPEGRGFEAQWRDCIFLFYLIHPVALGTRIYSASNRNNYEENNNKLRGL